MNRWGWAGVAAGTAAAAGMGLAFSGLIPGYSALWGLFPTTAEGFRGNVALMRRYLAAHPPKAGVDTAQNALAWHLMDDLAGTQFGYTVAGVVHTQQGNTVSNTLRPIPSGSQVDYAILGANPYRSGSILIGKYVTPPGGSQELWQVYSQAGQLPGTTSVSA